jgi:ABC-type multidrug transport system fused ATPase/permease subunit
MIITLCHYIAEVACWMVTGERQASRIRNLYLKTILRQDIAFFDTETTTGEVIGRMSGDTVLIQDAMGEKVNLCFFFKELTFAHTTHHLISIRSNAI